MREIKKTLFIYGDRGWNKTDRDYSEASINRGLGALSAYLEELQKVNEQLVIHSVSSSSFDLLDGNKRLYLTVLYTGEINDVLSGVLGRYGYKSHPESLDERSVNINDYDHNGYNKLICIEL